jgi:hypothetical protein
MNDFHSELGRMVLNIATYLISGVAITVLIQHFNHKISQSKVAMIVTLFLVLTGFVGLIFLAEYLFKN